MYQAFHDVLFEDYGWTDNQIFDAFLHLCADAGIDFLSAIFEVQR